MKRMIPRLMIPIVLAQAAAVQAQDLSQKVDSLFAAWDTPNSPGCALGVIRDGEFIYKRGYGMASLEHKVPISPTTVFLIGSASKMFTAAAIMLAEGQGHLSLDDDLRTYLPEIPDYGDTITIRHLLHHTSGMRDYYQLFGLAGEYPIANVLTNEEILALFARQEGLNFRPGTEYGYTSSNYVLLAMILERATGKSLKDYAEENIFGPLGMEHTHFHDDRFHVIENRANAYAPRAEGQFAFNFFSNYATVGGSGLWTTVEDLFLWDRNFYENKLAREDLVERLLTPGPLDTELKYASGHIVGEYRGLRFVGHDGSTMGFQANFVQFPEQRFSVICLCNLLSINPRRQAGQVAELYLADEFKDEEVQVEPIEVSDAQLLEMAGAYRDPVLGDILEVFAEEGSLVFHKEDGGITVLEPLSATRFRLPPGSPYRVEYEFYRTDSSEPWRLKATMRRYPPYTEMIFDYEPAELVGPADVLLPDYVGDYHSDELPATYPVTLENGELFVTLRKHGPLVLKPTIRDHFQVGRFPVYLEFVRDESGRVSGFDLRSFRLRNVRFVRQPDVHAEEVQAERP